MEHIDLEINDSETIAIVGENGSGKTTLVKLIMGLYPPDKGKTLVDGQNIAEIDRHNVFENVSAVFQNYQKYSVKNEFFTRKFNAQAFLTPPKLAG